MNRSCLNKPRSVNTSGSGSGPVSSNGTSRRKSVEWDLALRNTATLADKNNKPSLLHAQFMGPVPQPRRSLMSAAEHAQYLAIQQQQQLAAVQQAQASQQQQQLYQNQAQLQYAILQQQYQQQQQQLNAQIQHQIATSQQHQLYQQQRRPPRPMVRHTEGDNNNV